MDKEQKYSAPALARGLIILEELIENGPSSLELISSSLKIPKASVARILKTLCLLGYVNRDKETLKYSAAVSIVPLANGNKISKENIIFTLKKISEGTGFTSEWYVYERGAMILQYRHEIEHSLIVVRARVGYKRELDGEFEAVARTALAFGVPRPEKYSYWVYENGKKEYLSENRITEMLEMSKRNIATMDKEYNPNGIRRYAAPITDRHNRLIAVISLAESYTPQADNNIDKNLAILKEISINFGRI